MSSTLKVNPACCGAMQKALDDGEIDLYNDAAPASEELIPKWGVNGCCGQCYVLNGIKHCPFCGTALSRLEVTRV